MNPDHDFHGNRVDGRDQLRLDCLAKSFTEQCRKPHFRDHVEPKSPGHDCSTFRAGFWHLDIKVFERLYFSGWNADAVECGRTMLAYLTMSEVDKSLP